MLSWYESDWREVGRYLSTKSILKSEKCWGVPDEPTLESNGSQISILIKRGITNRLICKIGDTAHSIYRAKRLPYQQDSVSGVPHQQDGYSADKLDGDTNQKRLDGDIKYESRQHPSV